MQRDKLLLPISGTTIIDRLTQQLGSVCQPLLIVGRRYPLTLCQHHIIFLADFLENTGPLSGIAAALRYTTDHLHSEWLLVTAGDLPLIDVPLIEQLCRYSNRSNAHVIMPIVGSRHQPLFALYRTSLADDAERLLLSRRYRVDLLATGRTVHYVTEQDLGLKPNDLRLQDVDTPTDYSEVLKYVEELPCSSQQLDSMSDFSNRDR